MKEGPSGNSARDSVKWIQRAFSTVEPLEEAADTDDGRLRVSLVFYYGMTVTRMH